MQNNKILLSLAAALILLLGGYGLYEWLGSMKEEPKQKSTKPSKTFVQTKKVEPTEIQTQIVAFGRVESAQPVDIIAEVNGKIKEYLPLRVGQSVRQGQALFSLGKETFELSLQAQKSNFIREIAVILPDLKIDFPTRYDTWQSYFNQIEVDKPLPELPKHESAKEKTFLATKNILTSYYTIKSQEATLSKYVVYAPFSGTISEVYLQNGSVAPPNGRVLRLVQTNNLELKVPVDTRDIRWLKIGTPVEVMTEDAAMSWKGRIVRIGDIVNPNTQSLDVFISIENSKNPVYAGMYLRAQIEGGQIDDAVELPRRAVFNDNEVYTIKKDSLLHIHTVQVKKVNRETIVVGGLKEGEIVVTEPLISAYEDMVVSYRKETDMKENNNTSSSQKTLSVK